MRLTSKSAPGICALHSMYKSLKTKETFCTFTLFTTNHCSRQSASYSEKNSCPVSFPNDFKNTLIPPLHMPMGFYTCSLVRLTLPFTLTLTTNSPIYTTFTDLYWSGQIRNLTVTGPGRLYGNVHFPLLCLHGTEHIVGINIRRCICQLGCKYSVMIMFFELFYSEKFLSKIARRTLS